MGIARFWGSANLRIALSPLEAEAKKVFDSSSKRCIHGLTPVVFGGDWQIWSRVLILGVKLSTPIMFAEILKVSSGLESYQ